MFYHPLLLNSQHKMQLNFPWIAATLGIKQMKINDIIRCDIQEICKHLQRFMESESSDVKNRLSLRLSTMLIHGTVLIWRQQTIFLSGDISKFIAQREKQCEQHRLTIKEHEPDSLLTPQPVIKKKKKTKKTVVETPESLLALTAGGEYGDPFAPVHLPTLETEAILQARVDSITLREDIPQLQGPVWDEDFGGGLLPPRKEMDVDVLVEQVAIPGPVVPLELPDIEEQPRQQIVEEVEELAQCLEKEPPQIIAPGITVLPTSPKEKEATIPAETEPANEPDEDRWRRLFDFDDPLQLPEFKDPSEIIPKEVKDNTQKLLDKLRVKRLRKKFVAINQKMKLYNEEEEEEFAQLRAMIRPIAFVPMEKFFPELEEGVEHRAIAGEIPEEGSILGAASLEIQKDRSTSLRASLPQSTVPTPVSTGVKDVGVYASTPIYKRPLPVESLTEAITPGFQLQSPSKRPRIITELRDTEPGPSEQTISQLIPEIAEMEITAPAPRRERDGFGMEWAHRVMRVVDEHQTIIPPEICKNINQRLTRPNMARIFSCLLVLAKDGYVLLHPVPGSTELQTVEKGSKDFFNKY